MKLENFIAENRESMDVQLPPSGHARRFAERIKAKDAQTEKSRRYHHQMAWRIGLTLAAASIVLAMLMMLPISVRKDINMQSESVSEVAYYYRQQLDNEIARIEEIIPLLDKESQQELIDELRHTQENLRSMTEFPEGLSEEAKIAIVAVNYDNTINIVKNMECFLKKEKYEIKK